MSRPTVASAPELPPLFFFLNQLFPTFAPNTLPNQTRLCSEPQAHLAPTLGGYTRLLSSTVETINSQERLSTEIWGLKVRIREGPQKQSKYMSPAYTPSPFHIAHIVLAS